MSDLLAPTIPEMIKEAERELALRNRVYPRRITLGQMQSRHAERYLQLQKAIIAELHRAAAIRHALEAALPSLRDLVANPPLDETVEARDREVLAQAEAALT